MRADACTVVAASLQAIHDHLQLRRVRRRDRRSSMHLTADPNLMMMVATTVGRCVCQRLTMRAGDTTQILPHKSGWRWWWLCLCIGDFWHIIPTPAVASTATATATTRCTVPIMTTTPKTRRMRSEVIVPPTRMAMPATDKHGSVSMQTSNVTVSGPRVFYWCGCAFVCVR